MAEVAEEGAKEIGDLEVTTIPMATNTANTDNRIQTVVIKPAEIQNTPGGQEERNRAMKYLTVSIIKLNHQTDNTIL